ncbi:MAG: 2Fe-2S iron-sulfur cluster-binding protein, partial [Novosphingobium sp.]
MLKNLFGKKLPKKVRINKSGLEFEVGKNQTILEAALGQNIAYPHDCTVGTCGSCRSRLTSGKVDAITPFGYTLSREELADGFILACQAVPKTDVEVEVDLGAGFDVATCSARISEMVDLTHDIKRVTWKTDKPVQFQAGQYMNVSWPGGPGVRSYSFSNAPAADGNTLLSTFIRKVPGGAFTEKLFSGAFDAETPFAIEAPHGNFWLRDGDGPIILIGGGSGLSPLMSVLEDGLARGVNRNAILLFGGRGQRDLYCQ